MRLTGGIKGPPSVDPFEREHATTFNGRRVEVDTELTIRGAKGRCRFRAVLTNPRNGERSIEVIDGRGYFRAFPLDAVTTVHRIAKIRENAEQ